MCVCVMFCPEEICTLVIAEAFPEDGGLFCCTASNPYGSVNCTAHLTVTAGWYAKGDGRERGGPQDSHPSHPCSFTNQNYWSKIPLNFS